MALSDIIPQVLGPCFPISTLRGQSPLLGGPQLALLRPDFYGKPFILETEPDQEFLGSLLEFEPLHYVVLHPEISTR